MGWLNIKSLSKSKENIQKKLQEKLKPIVVKKTKSSCGTCGGR